MFFYFGRESIPYWKVKDIDPLQQRSKGYCPLTPKEVGIFLSALGYPSSTPIYIAAGGIYGGDSHMVDLQSRFPILMSKLASADELEPFRPYAAQMAALDYIVSVESDVFVSSYLGNMARAVEGHRRFLGHRRTITPDSWLHCSSLKLQIQERQSASCISKVKAGRSLEGKVEERWACHTKSLQLCITRILVAPK
ncbi:hypothetical protein BHE74_00003580 [Ensete ventricosum]|nr:hypothetical protein BHE74_00003580 [Ensete ventricosum]